MSGPFTGMDVAAVRTLSQQLTTKAGEIREIMSQLTTGLNNTQWVGADRERFVSDWQGTHVVALNNVIRGLEEAGTLATRNADEQDAASR